MTTSATTIYPFVKSDNTRSLMADAKFYESYSRWNEDTDKYETWDEAVDRVMNMHYKKYSDKITPELEKELEFATSIYKQKRVLGAQRALQFGGEQMFSHNSRLFNCVSGHINRAEVMGEYTYLLLSGAGVGFSIQKHHVAMLPKIRKRKKNSKVFTIPDSIEGWSEAVDVLMSSYFVGGGKHPEFEGRKIFFDSSNIRPQGAYISGGFKAPGPEPLMRGLLLIEQLINKIFEESGEDEVQMSPIQVYDILMFIADFVISGGVRRSATIALFSLDDDEMMNAKTGNWFKDNPQRRRSNISAVVIKDKDTKEDFLKVFESTKAFGEPGFIFLESTEFTFNPCVTADTMVLTDEGRKPVSDLIGKKFNAVVDGKSYETVSDGFWKTGNKAVYELTTKDGYSVRATSNHKILTTNGWKELGDIVVNEDKVILNQTKDNNSPDSLVVSINADSFEDVYDVTVEDVHRFDANGIIVHNCAEIGKYPVTEDGRSGWQGCCLAEINGSMSNSEAAFYENCRAASTICTLQAGYTDFKFLDPATKEIFDREALIGVSITGFMNSPDVLFDEEVLRKGAQIVVETNQKVAKMIGINPAARTTTTKPSGNASVLLGTASGIHAEHAKRYLRYVEMNNDQEVLQLISKNNQYMVEPKKNNEDTTSVVSFAITPPEGSVTREEMTGVQFLEKVKMVQQNWIEYGTVEEFATDKRIRHNVSNTVTVPEEEWDDVAEFIWENRKTFAGVSLLGNFGDKDYYQAPFTEVKTSQEIVDEYGDAAMFASGLIVDSHRGFDNLWDACDVVMYGQSQHGELGDLRCDWIRRFNKFAETYFDGNVKKASYCMKDVHLLHKWNKIVKNYQPVDFTELSKKEYTDISDYAAIACQGNGCEVI